MTSELAAGFAPNQKVRSATITCVGVVGPFSNDEWFYEEKRTFYSEQETERSKRKYTMQPGAKTQVFQNNYPSSSEKKPVTSTTEENWFNQEHFLTCDASYRQRENPNTASAATKKKPATKMEVNEQGQKAPTRSSPYQPAIYSTQTVTHSVPVANPIVPDSTKPLERVVELRPEDIVTTEGRWFNTESMVSYGRQTRDRNYQGIRTYKDDDDENDFFNQLLPQRTPSKSSSFVDVAHDTSPVAPQNTASKPRRESMDIATALPLKTRPRSTEEQKAEAKVETEATKSKSEDEKTKVVTMAADEIVAPTTTPDDETVTVDSAESVSPPTIQELENPFVAAENFVGLAASITSTDEKWFNIEQRDYLRPAREHIPYTIRNPEYHRHPNRNHAQAKASTGGKAAGADVAKKAKAVKAESNVSAGAFVPVNYTPPAPTSSSPSPPGADKSLATTTNKSQAEEESAQPIIQQMPPTVTTDQGWFNNEKRSSYESNNERRVHIPYRLIANGMDEASMRMSGLP